MNNSQRIDVSPSLISNAQNSPSINTFSDKIKSIVNKIKNLQPFQVLKNIFTKKAYEPIEQLDSPALALENRPGYQKDAFIKEYKEGNDLYGVEKGVLIPTVPKLLQQFQNKITDLKSALDLSVDEKEQNELQQELHLYQKYYDQALQKHDSQDSNHDWLNTQFFDLLNNRSDIDDYQKKIEPYFPGLINFTHQEWMSGEEKKSFARLGVITDFSNPFTNLAELRQLSQDPLALQTKITEVSQKKSEQAEFAKQELNNIENTLKKREIFLSEQMLQLVEEQVSRQLGSIKDGEPFPLFHLALLNPTNTDNKTFDEKNFLLDMATIFEDFKGKQLIFDGKGPLIDKEGNIHLSIKQENLNRVTLQPLLANISVQGSLKDSSLQNHINTQFFESVEPYIKPEMQDQFAALKAVISSGKSDLTLARDFLLFALNNQLVTSLGCRKAKDRTGVVAALCVQSFLNQKIDSLPNEVKSPAQKTLIKKRFNQKILDKDSVAVWNVHNNTNIKILKVTAFRIEGIPVLERLKYYFKQAPTMIKFSLEQLKKRVSFQHQQNLNQIGALFTSVKLNSQKAFKTRTEITSTRLSRLSQSAFRKISTVSNEFKGSLQKLFSVSVES